MVPPVPPGQPCSCSRARSLAGKGTQQTSSGPKGCWVVWIGSLPGQRRREWPPPSRTRVLDSEGDVMVMNPDGSRKTLVASSSGNTAYWSPTWPPDGERLAFVVVQAPDTASTPIPYLVYVRQYGGKVRELSRAHAGEPDWSPDGWATDRLRRRGPDLHDERRRLERLAADAVGAACEGLGRAAARALRWHRSPPERLFHRALDVGGRPEVGRQVLPAAGAPRSRPRAARRSGRSP